MPSRLARRVLEIEAAAIRALAERLDERFDRAVAWVAECRGRVITCGVGKSGIICRKMAATLTSTGTPAIFLHPSEAAHGDLGLLVGGDVVLMISNSGETPELIQLLDPIQRLNLKLIVLAGQCDSTLGRAAGVALDVGVSQEACPLGLAPTASTTAALALGDALALAVAEMRGFQEADFARLHPGGGLGRRLRRVSELMRRGEQLPQVLPEALLDEVVYEMSRKGLGITAVVDSQDVLLGVVSDGDLRRQLQKKGDILHRTAREMMTPDPITIEANKLASAALSVLEQRKITSLMVVDESNRLIGVLHLHDLWGTQMF